MDIRTDLAIELHAGAVEKYNEELDGITVNEEKEEFYKLTKICIYNDNGSRILTRPVGNYVTIEFGRVGISETDKFVAICERLQKELAAMAIGKCGKIPKKVLVAGLGNEDITADALGPLTLKSILVTAHLKKLSKELYESFGESEITALPLGVMAHTGMESADILKSVTEKANPELVIAVDALASNMMSRLAGTVQLTDTGICPGSGIGNHRNAINEENLNVPVISIGVPTMVEIATLVIDAFSKMNISENSEAVREKLGDDANVLVTPKDSGIIISDTAKMIAFSINKAFIPDLSYDEIARLVN